MLYRTPRFSALDLVRATATRLAGAIAAGHRIAQDTSRFDGLSEHHLRDLGLRRYEDRHFHETFYR
jgi:uncharacterized protein YjiS (DUF1127 family)